MGNGKSEEGVPEERGYGGSKSSPRARLILFGINIIVQLPFNVHVQLNVSCKINRIVLCI